ncbi:MAG: UTP--glucose-1-phosphate uridylyltransferase GalU [Alphaproteobacteria bacterium]|nr:UTP--glucose-1-phosphate uridylyltransferase GalU [Alphaproteobacteria bacterium]MDP1671028.1 UTP--glucose-1-phosphate uridylyltransferase GalU [Alphaproteobacteria bacterium]
MRNIVRKAVFPVAGLGTRFLPATKVMPKEMLTVVDKPLIQYAVEEAAAAGIEEFIFVTSRAKSVLEDHFDRAPELEETLARRGKNDLLEQLQSWLPKAGSVVSTRQQEPLGLGHAVWCAREFIGDEPFAVLLVDDLIQSKTPCLKQMVDTHQKTGGSLVLIEEVPRAFTNRYGILDVASDDGALVKVKGFVEKPEPAVAPSTLSIIGRYILQPQIFDYLSRQQRGAGNEIQLTDAMAAMLETGTYYGMRYEGTRYDCGDKLGYLKANMALALDRPDLAPGLRSFLKEIRV